MSYVDPAQAPVQAFFSATLVIYQSNQLADPSRPSEYQGKASAMNLGIQSSCDRCMTIVFGLETESRLDGLIPRPVLVNQDQIGRAVNRIMLQFIGNNLYICHRARHICSLLFWCKLAG